MNSRSFDVLVAVAILSVGYLLSQKPADPPAKPAPPPNQPAPAPAPAPEQKKPRRPWASDSPAAVAVEGWGAEGLFRGLGNGGLLGPDFGPCACARPAHRRFADQGFGDPEPMVDLLAMPRDYRPRNIASKGLGCCVFRSGDYCGRYQNIPAIIGMPEWMKAKGIEGGGWPEKVAELVPEIAADRGLPTPIFVQESGKGTALLELALKTGRPACITWNGNHMLNGLYWDGKQGAILDNNDPHRIQWFDQRTFLSKYRQGGGGWTLVFAEAPPPPPPTTNPAPAPQVREEPGAEPAYCWERALSDPEQWKLMLKGEQVGLWSGGKFVWVRPGGTSGECEPPILPPGKVIGAGVASGWKRSARTVFTLNGKEVSKEEAFAALADDSQLPFLTIIGSKADQEKVKPVVTPYLSKFRVKFVEPNYWAVSAPWGFVTTGTPTVYIQSACGKPLHRQDDASGLDAALASFGGTRKPDPNYQPTTDPDLRKSGSLGGVPTPAMILGAAGLLVALLPRKEQELTDDVDESAA